jgi:hypothetical protein
MKARDRIEKALASATSAYVTATERTDAQVGEICEALSRLTQVFLAGTPGWDSRTTWLDGVRPSYCGVRDGAVEVAGGAFVIISGETFVVPLVATVRADEHSLIALNVQFRDATSNPVPYDARFNWDKLSFPDEPVGWRYLFDLNGCLPRPAQFELPGSSNFYAALQGVPSPRDVADLYSRAGWATRACGWNEFEVSCDVAELVIEAVPVLLHGAVARPSINLNAVLAPLVESGIAFWYECYAPDGTLILQGAAADDGR